MKSILRRRPSPALVISMIALFVSLSGVSYGVATGFIDSREIKNNEIRSLDIRNNQIRTRDLRNNEVRGIDIRNSTVQGRDIALNTVTGEDINETTLGKVPSATERRLRDHRRRREHPEDHPADDGGRGRATPSSLATHGPLTLSARLRRAGLTIAEALASTRPRTTRPPARSRRPVPTPTSSLRGLTRTGRRADDASRSRTRPPAMAHRSCTVTHVFASAPSGKGFTGQVAIYADTVGAAPAASTGTWPSGLARARPRRRPAGPSAAASGGRRRTRRCRRAGGPGGGRSR